MKRVFDLVAALLVSIFLLPAVLVLICLVKFVLGPPVFFVQARPGLHGRPFDLIKFRTMRMALDKNGNPLADEHRLTRLGGFLRKTSLDELPELWNVLKGDMSIVGPRPLLMQYLTLYTPVQARRHEVRPGITGWAQINGRNAISWEEKFKLDVWYVDHQSFWLDMKILFLTFVKVFARSDINFQGHATMPEFTGQKDGRHKEF